MQLGGTVATMPIRKHLEDAVQYSGTPSAAIKEWSYSEKMGKMCILFVDK